MAGPDRIAAFHTVAVIGCHRTERRYPDGEWAVLDRQVATDGVDGLLAALVLRSESPSRGMCPAIGYLPPAIRLANGAGDYLWPRFPADECGAPLPAYERALAALSWRTVSTIRLRLDRSPTALASGCAMQWKNEVAIETATGSGPGTSSGGPVFTDQPTASLRACIYHTGAEPIAGDFRRAVPLDADQSAQLRDGLSGAGPSEKCPAQPDFAVVFAGRAEVNVELGGCWRVTRNDDGKMSIGTADAPTIRRLLRLP